jgi:hypothetical protein
VPPERKEILSRERREIEGVGLFADIFSRRTLAQNNHHARLPGMATIPNCLRTICIAAAICVVTLPALSAPKQILLGPPDAGAELGGEWYSGTNGAAYLFVDSADPNHGANDFTLGNKTAGAENRADWRSQLFSLGPAAGGAEPMTFSFAYKFTGKVNPGDNIAVFFRFFDETGTNFLGQHYIPLGSSSGDSEMTGYKTATFTGLRAVKNATGIRLPKGARTVTADIWVTCNIFGPWSSGDARFDDFSVTTLPSPFWISRHWLISLTALLIIVVLPTLTIWAIRKRRMG